MKLVILPGLDGTGILSKPFLKMATPERRIQLVVLNELSGASYSELADEVLAKIGDEKIVIVAESYSGMVAYEMARKSDVIKHIVFVASFLGSPSRVSRAAKYFPVSLFKYQMIPRWLISKFLFAEFSSEKVIELFFSAINEADPKKIKHRLGQIANLKLPDTQLDIPCTYIRPTKDNLVSYKAVIELQSVCSDVRIKEISGTHFVLETNPTECWEVINGIAV